MTYVGYGLIALAAVLLFQGVREANNMSQSADVRVGGAVLIVAGLIVGSIGCAIVAIWG